MRQSSEQVVENVISSKRVGRTCITLFFLAFVYAVFIGQGLFIVSEGDGYKINFVSAFGILLAFYCIFFVVRDYRAILKLSWFKMLLGFLGIAGFLTHAVLALFAPAQLLQINVGRPVISGAAGFAPMAATGAEQWIIEGRSYNIESSYFLVFPEGVQYTVTYRVPLVQLKGLENEQAELLAFPIMAHVVENELHLRSWIKTLDGEEVDPVRIGIIFLHSQGQDATGYRYGLSIDEIRKRIAAAENQP